MTNAEVDLMITALKAIVKNIQEYKKDYIYDNRKNIFWHKNDPDDEELMQKWFTLE
jgi:hypothetical protein